MAFHAELPVKLGIEMPPAMLKHLKIVCAKDGVSTNIFVVKAIEGAFADREERLDAEAYDRGMKELAEGKGESIESVRKELDL